jgi:basic membrane lipoprotein Med (substrate-binding protein (PBP1-ABC) superfamily)
MRLSPFVAVIFLGLLTGCPTGGRTSSGRIAVTPPVAGGGPRAFKVALVTPGPITDGGWNTLGWEGLEKIKKDLGAETVYVEQGNPSKFEDELKAFAQSGADVVFAHGFEYQDACEKVGAKFPKTIFITASGERAFANGAPMKLRLDEACYLSGILAAYTTKTKKIGAVGGMAIPPVKDGFDAYARAARKAKPDVTAVAPAYLGTWDDVAKGREQAEALIGAGCDVILHNADKAGQGVFAAAKDKKIFAIGSNRDQNADNPGVVIGSATADIARCMLDLAREVKEGRFKPRVVTLDMKSGYVDLTLAPDAKIPDEARAAIDAARKAILAGTLDPLKD